MNRIKVSDNFFLDEFIDPYTYSKLGARSITMMDARIIDFAEWLRDTTGTPIVINNWARGGQFRHSGFRPRKTTIGAEFSQHRAGRAIDVKVSGWSTKKVHDLLFEHENLLINRHWCTRIEDAAFTPTWVHCDNAYTGQNRIIVVKP